jgi:hypothetical protein
VRPLTPVPSSANSIKPSTSSKAATHSSGSFAIIDNSPSEINSTVAQGTTLYSMSTTGRGFSVSATTSSSSGTSKQVKISATSATPFTLDNNKNKSEIKNAAFTQFFEAMKLAQHQARFPAATRQNPRLRDAQIDQSLSERTRPVKDNGSLGNGEVSDISAEASMAPNTCLEGNESCETPNVTSVTNVAESDPTPSEEEAAQSSRLERDRHEPLGNDNKTLLIIDEQ